MCRQISVLAIVLFACASAKPNPVATAPAPPKPTLASNAGGPDAKGKYVCEYEEPVGTHVPKKVCRYVDEGDTDPTRDELQNSLRKAPGTTNVPPSMPKTGSH
jgi:hypothetical protein